VRTFGFDVNFAGGSSLDEIPSVEAIRRGIIFIPDPSELALRFLRDPASMLDANTASAPGWWMVSAWLPPGFATSPNPTAG
jgi:hypothetical protein